jgi:hypothetical protein
MLKAAVAAAAVIPLAVLFLNTSTASGITLAQMFKAFGKAQNIHVSTFGPSTGNFMQEFWISRDMNRFLMARGEERALYDLEARRRYVYRVAETPPDVGQLNEQQYHIARHLIDACLGFTLTDVPADAKWSRRQGDTIGDTDVYELTYTERDRSGASVLRRWMLSIDPVTKLPKEGQAFRRPSDQEEWVRQWRMECQYPTPDEMAAIIGSR